jgi:predicted MFS family arabinose efflux permease
MDNSPSNRLAGFLALNRTVTIVLVSVLLFGLGEELWRSFMPAYLKSQAKEAATESVTTGAISAQALWAVGVFAFLLNLFEAFCYIAGGKVTAWLGDRGSLFTFGCMTVAGYLLFLLFPHELAATILASLLILGWEPLSVPVTFTTVGTTVGKEKQAMAFALQSIQKRLPKLLGPAIAGLVLGWLSDQLGSRDEGIRSGTWWLVSGALFLGIGSLVVQWIFMPDRKQLVVDHGPPAPVIVRDFHPTLKRLLLAEVFTRWCDWLVREFVVLYVLFVRGISLEETGLLIALQHLVALLTYVPIGKLSQHFGGQPFIGLTFVFFALFPLVLVLVPDNRWLPLAFVVYGLREVGEPARKALITSLMPQAVRARGVGLYWGIRSLAICWASLVGALIWQTWGPGPLLYAAFGFGVIGAGIFYAFARLRVSATLATPPR